MYFFHLLPNIFSSSLSVFFPFLRYDSRRHGRSSSKDWADKKTLGGRAHFDIKASPSALVIDRIRESDAGHYRCRVDFKNSPTRKARTNLTVISKLHFSYFVEAQ